MRKKIAIIITKLELGGAQQTALHLAGNLDRVKYEVHLVAGTGGYFDEYAASIPDLKLALMKSFKHPIRPPQDIRAFREIKKYLLQHEIELVHTHSSKAGFLGRMAARAAGIPIIVHSAHGFSFHEYQNPITHRIYLLLEKYVAKRSTALIAGGYDVKEYGLQNKVGSEDMYSVIYAGVDLESFRNATPDRDSYLKNYGLKGDIFTVGMVGNLKKQKNPLEFLEIAKQVLATERNMQFIFAGDGPLRKKVDSRLQKYGAADKVKFVGWIDNAQAFINCIDVFLLTSLWEGLPCTLSQAIAAGKPCIATNIGGNREILNEINSGFLYEPGRVEKAAEIILTLKNNDLQESTVDNGKESYLSRFDFRHILKQHEHLYDRLLKR